MLDQIKHIYETKYRTLLLISFCILFLSIGQISYQYITTGDFLHKGVSLKGGLTLTVPVTSASDPTVLATQLLSLYPDHDISVRELRGAGGQQSGLVIDADFIDKEAMDSFILTVAEQTGIAKADISMETFGSRLSQNFFEELFIGLLITFFFMGIVIFLYFRDFVPSIAVMLSAASDIIISLAIVNVLGIKLSSAGIAAFLMLIGYSIDTDTLLTIRVIKQKTDGTLNERIYGALKTGGLMTLTAIAAVAVVLIFTNSDVLFQIMLILFIGLIVDLMTTWVQNVGILRWHLLKLEQKGKGVDAQ
ncbi:protein translocase subunit SecF [Candidatus Woesearchaeota archaeon]|nr:protein translocase subunit SecF [Candidatus Woesearchaeota archaeon]